MPAMLRGGVYVQWIRCGHLGCKCMKRNERHGPYFYHFWREGGRLLKRYVRREDADAVRAACSAWRQARRESRDAQQQWRQMLALIREIERSELP
jgi:hypothetical protein